MNNKEKEETREDLCLACVTTPLAMVGAGVSGAGSKNRKKVIFYSGVVLTIISIIVALYFFFRCEECRAAFGFS